MEANQHESLSLPTMFGDHHVVQVRQIVAALPGVTDILASAARRKITVTFNRGQLTVEALSAALTQAGFAPGLAAAEALGSDEHLPIVKAADQINVRESKYSPPPSFGVCPGLETRFVGMEHPADKK